MAIGNNISDIYRMNVGGKTFQVDPAAQGGYLKAYEQYANDAAAQRNLYNQQFDTNTSNLKQTLAQNNATTNANYDNSARQAYVDYMRKQRSLPSQLQALGVRGGATESGLLNLYNNYGVEHAANEQQRNADLTTNQQTYDDAYAKLVADRTQYLMDYEKDLAAQKQQAINNQINEYNNEITRFSSSVAQYPTTKDGYKQYEAWIANMEASNDPLKDIKVALIRQQMATQFPDGDPGGSGSGGSGGGGGYSRRGGYSRSGSGGSDTDRNTATAETAFNATKDAFKGLAAASAKAKSGTVRQQRKTNTSNKWAKYGIKKSNTNRWVG